MIEQFCRTELLLGEENIKKLQNKRVFVFGLGGVGSFAVESLARAGVGNFLLCDNDVISESNINRQLFALHSTVGKYKCDVAKDRLLDINPNLNIELKKEFFTQESVFDFDNCDYILDCIDTVTSKLKLVSIAKEKNINIISALGSGNKTDASKLVISKIKDTSVCPLARVMRCELRKMGIDDLTVCYSTEIPLKAVAESVCGRHSPASISYVPAVMGLLISQKVIADLIK